MGRDYLTRADILEIHTGLIETYGGSGGLRDPGQLEAAIFRPQSGYYPDVIAEAAALSAHPTRWWKVCSNSRQLV